MAARAAVGSSTAGNFEPPTIPRPSGIGLPRVCGGALGAGAAAAGGFVDEIVDPAERERLMWASLTLSGARRDPRRQAPTDNRRHQKDSNAFHAASRAQEEGATVLLTSFGRVRRLTERAAQRLAEPLDAPQLDVNNESDLERAARRTPALLGIRRRVLPRRSPSRPRTPWAATS